MSTTDTSKGYGVYLSEESKAIGGLEPVDNLNGIVSIFSTKGVVNKPVYVTSQATFSSIYGSADIENNYSIESTLNFLEGGNGCWVNRIGLGFEQYNLLDFEFTLSGNDATFSGDENIYSAKSLGDVAYVDGVTSDDVDIETIKNTELADDVNLRLYTKYPVPLSGYTVTITEDENYQVNDVTDSTDEFYFPANQVFRYRLLDADGFAVGNEDFLFSLVSDVRDYSTNRLLFVDEAFKQSQYFGAVFGKIIPTDITDSITGSTTYTKEEFLIVEDSITEIYDYTTAIGSLSVNPVSFFFNDRHKYGAKVQFEGGYNNTIKAKMEDWMKSCTTVRADILSFYDSINITNMEYQTIISDLKANLSTIIATSFSYERDVICTDWGEYIYDGRTYYMPDSWKSASDQLNSYKTYIVDPAFGQKQNLVKNYLAPVIDVKRSYETKMEKYRLNFARKLATGYYPFLGLTAYPKSTPEKNIHVQWLKLFILDVAERFLEPYIGEFNNRDTEQRILIGLDSIFQPIRKFLDADWKIKYTKISDDSIQIEMGIKPTGAIKYIYFNLITYDNEETMNRDFE